MGHKFAQRSRHSSHHSPYLWRETYCIYLLRRTYREGCKVKNETVSTLSHLPEPMIDLIRRTLCGETLVNPAEQFEIARARTEMQRRC